MFIILVSLLLIVIRSSTIYQALNETQLSSSSVGNCQILPKIDYYQLNTYNPTATFSFTITEAHYEVDIYIDFYLMGDFLEQPITIIMDGILINEYTVEYDNNIPFCDSTVSNQLKTFTTSYTHYQKNLDLTIQIISSVAQTVGVRNIQIVPKICHQNCNSCVGPNLNQCRSCFTNAQLSRVTNQCKCPNELPFLSQSTGQCLSKCELREYYDKDICVIDQKIKSLNQYFWSDYNFNGWYMIENYVVTSIATKTYQFSGGKVVGLFLPTQSVTYKFTNSNPFNSLRIRADIYIFQSTKTPQIELTVDKIQFQANPLYNKTSALFTLYQIDEVIDCEQNSNITITIQSDSNTRWGINSIVLNEVNCQANCATCSSKVTCNVCDSGYYLYKGKCVGKCPNFSAPTSNTCIDESEALEQPTTILLRAFENNITSDFVVQNTDSILSYNETKFGTYYNGYRYFGGLKDNHNQFYQKVFTQLPPHYAIILQFKIQQFQFSTGEASNNQVQLFYDKQQLQLIDYSDSEVTVNQKISHTQSSLKLTMLSVAQVNTFFSFGIRDLNIMIQRCTPLCRRCSGSSASDCQEWIYEQNSNGNNCNSGFIFDIEAQKCVLCPIGCSSCIDQYTCSICDENYIKQGSSCFCQNGYIDEFTLDCIIS